MSWILKIAFIALCAHQPDASVQKYLVHLNKASLKII